MKNRTKKELDEKKLILSPEARFLESKLADTVVILYYKSNVLGFIPNFAKYFEQPGNPNKLHLRSVIDGVTKKFDENELYFGFKKFMLSWKDIKDEFHKTSDLETQISEFVKGNLKPLLPFSFRGHRVFDVRNYDGGVEYRIQQNPGVLMDIVNFLTFKTGFIWTNKLEK
eukprot:gene7685-12151_t